MIKEMIEIIQITPVGIAAIQNGSHQAMRRNQVCGREALSAGWIGDGDLKWSPGRVPQARCDYIGNDHALQQKDPAISREVRGWG